jgi:2-polyprenyl-3-methyl-5-hydroxy-6-metoxy-1,4-benzoquinol methylase
MTGADGGPGVTRVVAAGTALLPTRQRFWPFPMSLGRIPVWVPGPEPTGAPTPGKQEGRRLVGTEKTAAADQQAAMFEPAGWDARYAGKESVWRGTPNPQLVAVAEELRPGRALDVGCGEGGDVIWLARQGWTVTGADFSAAGLARAARHAEEAGVAGRTDWWRTDARAFAAGGRTYDLVTTHYLHPPNGAMVDVVGQLAEAVAPGGHLLVVGHSPTAHHTPLSEMHLRAMFLAEELVAGLPDGFEVLAAQQRPRTLVREGAEIAVEDSTLLARRRPE